MTVAAGIFALIAALLHIMFFLFESVLWTRPSVWARFGIKSQAEAQVLRPMALNQGYYNLFLAIGVVVGVTIGNEAIVIFGLSCMLGASLVLVISNPKLLRPAVIQGFAPLFGLALTLL